MEWICQLYIAFFYWNDKLNIESKKKKKKKKE